ncbi:MAG: metallophosphatase family protein [Chloroflexota bacterium]|nr:metallophosphatase family protein [Chloroflexota bacterium]
MRVLLIADIHANLIALEAVVEDAGPVDAVWCLGDVVGYGPRPNECCAWVEEHAAATVVGNHDRACLGRLDLREFNASARQATRWTIDRLTPRAHDWLDGLPERVVEGDRTLVHGSPRDPVWEYILGPAQALPSFGHFDTDLCLVGHTHIPAVFSEAPLRRGERPHKPGHGESIALTAGRYIVNPGSVGQPRDGDPRAAYALYDPEARRIEFRRLAYDIGATQRQMAGEGLPSLLIARLAHGL